MKKIFGDYYLGLDIGTNSVGWAVTDPDYKIQKLNGKALWGIRLFEEGNTAEERRLYRSARRRLQRKVQRLKLLQELFAVEITKIDPGFFLRLSESKYHPEDKTDKQTNGFFNDLDYIDKDYHKKYLTIYHLRKALIENKEQVDIRLAYLAIHHIIKNRGHFLFEGKDMENIASFQEAWQGLQMSLKDELELEFYCNNIERLEEILKNQKIGIQEKRKTISQLLDAKTPQKKAIIGLLVGASVALSDIFDDPSYKDGEVNKVSFSSSSYEEDEKKLETILEDRMFLIQKIKTMYDWAILAEIRKGHPYLSFAKVASYNKHKEDLKKLKKLIKEYYPEQYKTIFHDITKNHNYVAYIGMSKINNKKQAIETRCSQEDLCKYLEKIIGKPETTNQDYQYLISEIQNRSLLPKQVLKDNGVIPYQIHLEELKLILENISEHFDFLKYVDDSNLSVQKKIIKIMTFRIPYYVGPLNDAHKDKKGSNCWIVKRNTNKITPWNFEDVVDTEASATEFIKRMTNKCTYLVGEDVLPKNSLLYSEFAVLNELNNLKINGEAISVDIKQQIYKNLFMERKKITGKLFKKYLESEGIIEKTDEISGIDGDFASSLTSFLALKNVVKEKVYQTEVMEEIIQWVVLFGDDRKLLKKKIEKSYKTLFTEEEKKDLCKLKFSGWGRLSKKFLENIYDTDKSTGECISIISAMRDRNDNLMKLLSNRYEYLEEIKVYNAKLNDQVDKITYEMVDNLYVSPAVKRSIWQTLTIVQELAKIMNHPPKKVFVEVAREEGEKKRTISRKDSLIALYKNCKEEERNWIEELNSKSESDLRSDKLYLYYTQMGRCMYTNEPISLSNLFKKTVYDVDHIYPQSKIKDDSLANRVLVYRTVNSGKSDSYPLPKDTQEKMRNFWTILHKKGLIDKKKYDRLVRTTSFDDAELAEFIARQLVETRQSTKAVTQILEKVFQDTQIVYVKAGNVSDFRHQKGLVKVREINDYHHAKDAFLNIIVGNVFHTKFTSNPSSFIKEHNRKKYNLKRMYDIDVERSGSIAWKAGDIGTIVHIRKTMEKNNILFTRHATEKKGGLFDQTLMKKGKGQMPIKSSDPRLLDIQKYGGYNKVSGAYFMLVEHIKEGKKARTIEFVPSYLAKQCEQKSTLKIEYCLNHLRLEKPNILLPKIKINSLFKVDGFYMHLSGRTDVRLLFKNGNQLILNEKETLYFKQIIKYINRTKEAKKELLITEYDKITGLENLEIFTTLLFKMEYSIYNKKLLKLAKKINNKKETFINLTLYEQCKLLIEILNLFQCNSVTADISLIGGGKDVGDLRLSKTISSCKEISIINQSPTGVFSQDIDLLKI